MIAAELSKHPVEVAGLADHQLSVMAGHGRAFPLQLLLQAITVDRVHPADHQLDNGPLQHQACTEHLEGLLRRGHGHKGATVGNQVHHLALSRQFLKRRPHMVAVGVQHLNQFGFRQPRARR